MELTFHEYRLQKLAKVNLWILKLTRIISFSIYILDFKETVFPLIVIVYKYWNTAIWLVNYQNNNKPGVTTFFKLYENCYNALDYDFKSFIHRFSFFLAEVAFEINYFTMKTKTRVCLHL